MKALHLDSSGSGSLGGIDVSTLNRLELRRAVLPSEDHMQPGYKARGDEDDLAD